MQSKLYIHHKHIYNFVAHQVKCQPENAALTISTHDVVLIVSKQKQFIIQLK